MILSVGLESASPTSFGGSNPWENLKMIGPTHPYSLMLTLALTMLERLESCMGDGQLVFVRGPQGLQGSVGA